MKTYLIPILLFCLISHSSIAQQAEKRPKIDESSKISSAIKSPSFSIQCVGETNRVSADRNWLPILSSKCIRKTHNSPEEENIRLIKAEKTHTKLEQYKKNKTGIEKTSATGGPVIGTNYLGNPNDGHSPMDNSIAISNDGWIVSVANTTIEFDDINGNNTYFNTIPLFFNFNGITVTCDPVVIYDSGADRFIIFAQECSGNSANSYLLIAFSKTNNPNDGFWKYQLTGNPKNNSKWFDYPKLAVSTNELYISGNLFSNGLNPTFSEAILYQIEKNNGYSGANINWQYWTGIGGAPFTLLPVSYGHAGNYGPGCFLVSTRTNTNNNSFNFYDLTDDMAASNEQLNYYAVPTTPYSPAGDASQFGTSIMLDNGSCRALSGFYLNGIIHFVFHCDVGGGWNGINYNRFDLNAQSNQSSKFGAVGIFDYSYPSVASFASSPSDPSVIINFGSSGPSIYPEVRAVHVDNNLNWSNTTLVKSSESFVTLTSTVTERWGDYTGIARKHNASIPTVWLNGMYGTSSNLWNTWIAEVFSSPVGINEKKKVTVPSKVFPNPIIELFSVEFELEKALELTIYIKDVQGKVVKELYKGQGNAGINSFTFNKANLANGTYFLVITNNSTLLKNEKISINN